MILLIPNSYSLLEIDGSSGNMLKTSKVLTGTLECEVDRVRYYTTLSFSGEDTQTGVIGGITLHTATPNARGQTDFNGVITKVRIGISEFSIFSQIDGLCQRSPAQVQLIGTLTGSCSKYGNIFLMGSNGLPESSTDTGIFKFDSGDLECQEGDGSSFDVVG